MVACSRRETRAGEESEEDMATEVIHQLTEREARKLVAEIKTGMRSLRKKASVLGVPYRGRILESMEAKFGPESQSLISQDPPTTSKWYWIPGHPGYAADETGVIWSAKSRKWIPLSPTRNVSGHLKVGFYESGRTTFFYVHCLVLEAFTGPRPPGRDCCHNDGNPENNSLANLRWDTRRQNQLDTKKHGTWTNKRKHGKTEPVCDGSHI